MDSALAPKLSAPQHKPRPLTLFLEMLRSEAAAKPERMAAALAGLRAYQEAPRAPPLEPMPVVASAHGAVLRDYGGNGAPVLFVPSLINPPNVLDLSAERSLLRWLAGRGHRVLLLDWGWDAASRRGMTLADHVERILLPLAQALTEPPALVGYCLGGTMALAAGALAVGKELGWNADRVNVNGGAISIGHPIGASGARVLTTLLYEMQRRDAKKGLATLCIGGGMGIALCVER